MTTQKMYETVLEQYGFKLKEEGPELRRGRENKCFVDFKKNSNKTFIQLHGVGRGGAIDTGWIRVSKMQLNSLLTIIVQNHF